MWHEKQKNCSLSDQTTSPKKSCGDYVYSKVLPPSGNHVDRFNGFSGKRKLAAIDLTRESNIKEFRLPVGVTEQESKHGVRLKKSFAEQTSSQQHTNHDNYRTDFLEVWSTSGADSRKNITDKSNDASLIVSAGSLPHKEAPSSTMMPVGENVMVPNQQAWACQYEAHRSLPLPESCNAISVAAQSVIESRNSVRSRLGNHTIQDNLQHELCSTKSEHLVSARNSIQGVQINGSTEDSNKRACSQKDYKYETPCELKQSGLCSNTIGTSNPPCTEQCENCETLQNEVQFRGSMLGFLSGNTYESDEQNHVRSQQKAVAPEMENSKNTAVDDILSSNGSRPDTLLDDGQNIVQHHGPCKADENIKLSSENPMITVADKLWDGRVQLSSSVTVSAVAFFKSGEKLPDTSWSEFIEVKGKVRLEAFEKYIQELPRSRNRGLMVLSLKWKEGSSQTEFVGMKEVSNGYKKGKKVGYAQLSAGTDLYICPRSNTIITILANYGFFKGMSAIEDNQDSLIGCVVWRKSQVCLNSVTKTLESKCKSSSEQPKASVSGSLSNQVAGKRSFPTQPGQQVKATQHVTSVSTPSLECSGRNGNEIKKIESCNVYLEIEKSSSAVTVPATPSVPSNISVTQVAQKMSVPSHGPCQASSGPLFEVKESLCLTAISGVEQSKVNWQKKNAFISVQYNAKKLCTPTFDQDDLPEYDFGIARGISSTALSKGVGVGVGASPKMLDMKLPARGNIKLDGLESSTMAILSAPSQRLDDIHVPTYHSAPYQGKPSPKVVCKRVCVNSRNHNWEEQCSVQGKAITMPPAAAAFVSTGDSCTMLTKNRFLYDDDDMPEWCPPEPYKQSLGETNRPSTTIPPKLPDSSFTSISFVIPQSVILPPPPPRPVILHPPPPRPVILPPPPSPIRSQFSYQQLHPALQVPITVPSNSLGPVPIQSNSRVVLGFNSNSALRLQSSSLDIRPPYQFSGIADWRPQR